MVMHSLSEYAGHILKTDESCLVIIVENVKGSAPCEVGATMLVTASRSYGTIGGGSLEWDAIQFARNQLKLFPFLGNSRFSMKTNTYNVVLGKGNIQCCGGSVQLGLYSLDESVVKKLEEAEQKTNGNMPYILLFGMGHIGQAVVSMLGFLPVKVLWFDQIASKLPKNYILPSNCEMIITDDQEAYIGSYHTKTALLVMTHSHQLDSLLIEKALLTPDLDFIGMIGSDYKRRRFVDAYLKNGLNIEQTNRLVCPIGQKTVDKRPAIIAAQITGTLACCLF
ncbi:xanthine dehydrogenase accessory protein XdhC [Entomobacter blattae]|uniref:XdhC Rossmann domain protein n=1 Tax=Entomobacter blattae TaxID=2762277 RepID=A0A7H1NU71_9PROT|nr:xanthine dehydrogenase accessory protein XdhC [Entomobacter blattae]QNT79331.1 XdhC Rossmann domain protein [Entomobacter blattae]